MRQQKFNFSSERDLIKATVEAMNQILGEKIKNSMRSSVNKKIRIYYQSPDGYREIYGILESISPYILGIRTDTIQYRIRTYDVDSLELLDEEKV